MAKKVTARPKNPPPPSHLLKPLNFRVDPEFHREFKTLASQQGISMLELLQRAFTAYKKQSR